MADELTRLAAAHDASHFYIPPSDVVRADSIEHVAALMGSRGTGQGFTFRGGGTSLSGQGQTADTLVDVRRHFRGVQVHDGGSRITCQPGTTLRYANAVLNPYQRKLGPDPASDGAATIGGIVANNSSGMTCGTEFNSYKTIDGLTVVLPSGSIIDTGAPDADQVLHRLEPDISSGLVALRQRILDRPHLVDRIRQQFSMKNTMGYGLNSLLDYSTPAAILEHVMVGSEGTLGFIGSATFRTLEKKRYASTALLVFPSTFEAMSALEAIKETGASSIEFMDAESLTVGNTIAGVPDLVRDLRVDRQAALLVEHEGATAGELEELASRLRAAMAELPLESAINTTTDPRTRSALWSFRKGLYTTVAGARPAGSTALLEDVAVPVASLAETCEDLTSLFDAYGYRSSVIFGHAKDGNIHFMLTDTFSEPGALDRYERFTADMVDLILDRKGTLKAEHGTGRVMAPFVRRQYGDELYDIMVDLKRLIDPDMVLNRDTILTDRDTIYLENFKETPEVDPDFDRCTECGFCEPVCPSEDLTLTPRQRIAVMREISAGSLDASQMGADYEYQVLHTCAADSMCASACPLGIDTGELVKKQRADRLGRVSDRGWDMAAQHWGTATRGASAMLTVANAAPAPIKKVVRGANAAARLVVDRDLLPQWEPSLPAGGRSRRRPDREKPSRFLYIPACVNTMFGPDEGSGVQDALLELADAAGVSLTIPSGVDSLCCGTVWSSKGAQRGLQTMRDRVAAEVREHGDAVTIITDASACTQGFDKLLENVEGMSLSVIDAVSFVRDEILPHLDVTDRLDSITLHPTCSSTQIGMNDDLEAVAQAVARDVVVPAAWKCCGFAGDRGMLHPELTESATKHESRDVAELDSEAHASCNRTCEIGMTRSTGTVYRHILEVLRDRALTTGE